jgi:hypothetical protein
MALVPANECNVDVLLAVASSQKASAAGRLLAAGALLGMMPHAQHRYL